MNKLPSKVAFIGTPKSEESSATCLRKGIVYNVIKCLVYSDKKISYLLEGTEEYFPNYYFEEVI